LNPRLVAGLLYLLAFGTVSVAQSGDEVDAALARLDGARQDENWFFTMHLTENDERRVITHDPSADPYIQRELVSVDGETPDEDALEEFREQEKERVDERDPEASYSYLVDTATLEQLGVDGDTVEYAFDPRIKAMEDSLDKMSGKLRFDTASGDITSIEVFNTEELSPAFSVTVNSYRLTFRFHEEQGARLLQRMESHAVGKAGFVKGFDSLVVVDFSDYRAADAVRE